MARLNEAKTNAVLVCHALTGDQHLASTHPVTGKPGWWDRFVGPGKPLDPKRHLHHLHQCRRRLHGHDGPGLDRPGNTGQPYGLKLPVITIADMVRAQAMLIEAWASRPCSPRSAARWAACRCCSGRPTIRKNCSAPWCIAAAARHSAQNIAFHEVGRQAIMADPNWMSRRLSLAAGVRPGEGPGRGAHGRPHHLPVGVRRCSGSSAANSSATACHGASTPISRSKATCATRGPASSTASTPTAYLYITRALDYFDLAGSQYGGVLAEAFMQGAAASSSASSVVLLRLALPHAREPRRGARPERRGLPRLASPRSRPTRATTPSSWTSPCSISTLKRLPRTPRPRPEV